MKLQIADENIYCYNNGKAILKHQASAVFIHGSGMDHTIWTPFVRHFARHGCNALAPDLPGHGRSQGRARRSISEISDWIISLLDELEIETTSITGHSLGSLIALNCAARYPSRINAIAMVGTTAPMPVSDAILSASAENDPIAYSLLTEYGYSRSHLLGSSPSPGMWMVGNTLRLFARSAPGVLNADMYACDSYQRGLEDASKITCPVAVILGEKDRLTPPRGAENLLQALPEPAVTVIEGVGHMLTSEAPNALLDALKPLLQR
ncbi:MAG: alpha/beta hydrolase [Pseudomonadota bacterium]